jgi:hypothetical protein
MSHRLSRGDVRRGGVLFLGNRLISAKAWKNDVKPMIMIMMMTSLNGIV